MLQNTTTVDAASVASPVSPEGRRLSENEMNFNWSDLISSANNKIRIKENAKVMIEPLNIQTIVESGITLSQSSLVMTNLLQPVESASVCHNSANVTPDDSDFVPNSDPEDEPGARSEPYLTRRRTRGTTMPICEDAQLHSGEITLGDSNEHCNNLTYGQGDSPLRVIGTVVQDVGSVSIKQEPVDHDTGMDTRHGPSPSLQEVSTQRQNEQASEPLAKKARICKSHIPGL